MRKALIILPLLLVSASPAFAQDDSPAFQLPPELTDPAAQMRIVGQLQALSNAIMNMRIGEVNAAIEGREAGPRERYMTVGDYVRRQDPNFDRDVAREVATVGPKIQQTVRAVNRALPQVMRDVNQAQRSIERAVANLPDPNYPVR